MAAYDLHQHLWPPSLIAALQARTSPPRLRGTRLELPHGGSDVDLAAHDLDARLAALDRDEIDVALISCPPSLELDAELTALYHEGIAELVAASDGRLRALACQAALDGFAGASVCALDLLDPAVHAVLFSALEERG